MRGPIFRVQLSKNGYINNGVNDVKILITECDSRKSDENCADVINRIKKINDTNLNKNDNCGIGDFLRIHEERIVELEQVRDESVFGGDACGSKKIRKMLEGKLF